MHPCSCRPGRATEERLEQGRQGCVLWWRGNQSLKRTLTSTGECVWPPSCNGEFLAVFVSEGAVGPPPRKPLNDGNPCTGAGVSTTYTSSEGAHISARGLLTYALLAIRQARARGLAILLNAEFCPAEQGGVQIAR